MRYQLCQELSLRKAIFIIDKSWIPYPCRCKVLPSDIHILLEATKTEELGFIMNVYTYERFKVHAEADNIKELLVLTPWLFL